MAFRRQVRWRGSAGAVPDHCMSGYMRTAIMTMRQCPYLVASPATRKLTQLTSHALTAPATPTACLYAYYYTPHTTTMKSMLFDGRA